MAIVLEDEGSEEVAKQVIEASRANYAKEYISKKKKSKPKPEENKKDADTKTEPETTQEDDDLPEMDEPVSA